MGVDIAATDDGIVMMGLAAQNVDAGDHRMAMALAVAALIAGKPSTIQNYECANTSLPGFFTMVDTIAEF